MSKNFMKLSNYLLASLVAVSLAACGGGGGNPGSVGGSTGSSGNGSGTNGTTTGPVIAMSLVDGSGVAITNHALSQTSAQFLKISLKTVTTDAAGTSTSTALPFEKVSLTLDSPEAVLVPAVSSQLTDANGELLVRIAPASVTSTGAVTATANASVNGTALSATYVVQATTGSVGLTGLTATPASVQKGGSVNVSVDVTVNGLKAPSNSVSVTFSSSCGTAAPSPVLVDGAGKAKAVVQTNISGACTVSVSAPSMTTPPTPVPFTVTEPPLAGLQFVSATPSLIYQTGSAGANTSLVKFKVVDALGNAITTGQRVNASLTNTDGGINFCGAPASATTAPDGTVGFSVCAGTLPATVQVQAVLADFPTVPASYSNLLSIQTGLPTQRFFDISATKLNFYAGGYFTDKFNGNTSDISVYAADRQGNPVPDGTKIIFVTEGGQFNTGGQSSCSILNGKCSVALIGQEYRPMGSNAAGGDPRPGRVTVLAYADGEEYFIDKPDATGVYNNRYDAGELFEDLGNPYVDKDENNTFVSSYQNLVTNTNEGETLIPLPSGAAGLVACPTNSDVGLSAAGTCNGKWDGYTKVRRTMVIVFSGGDVGQPGSYDASIPSNKRTAVISASKTYMQFRIADYDGNPMPSDATLSASISPSTSACKVDNGFDGVYGNTVEPREFGASLTGCNTGDSISFNVTVNAGGGTKKTGLSIAVP